MVGGPNTDEGSSSTKEPNSSKVSSSNPTTGSGSHAGYFDTILNPTSPRWSPRPKSPVNTLNPASSAILPPQKWPVNTLNAPSSASTVTNPSDNNPAIDNPFYEEFSPMYLSNSDISTEQYKLKQRIGDIARTIEDEELMRRKTKEYLAKLSVRIATEYYFHNIQIDQINRDKYFFFLWDI